jgi:hypothetical protein
MYVCIFVVLSCVGRGTAMGRFYFNGAQRNCLKGLTVPEVNSESEQLKRPDPRNTRHFLLMKFRQVVKYT